MGIVPSFAKAILSYLDAPAGQVTTFSAVRLEGQDGKKSRPDGAIRVKRGSKEWWCLVEVKTGKSELGADQVERPSSAIRVATDC